MDIEIIIAIISGFTSVMVAVASGLFARYSHKQTVLAKEAEKREAEKQKKLEERASERARESLLLLELQTATMRLALCSAEKLAGLKVNGSLTKAVDLAEKVNVEYEQYMQGIHAEHMVYGSGDA